MDSFKIVDRRENENNKEYVFRFLRFNIMTLKMPPGTIIKENEIASFLNLSRTPVHEAVLMLKEQYLVDVLPQSGSKVSYVDLSIVREGYFMRNLIEPAIIRELAGNIDLSTLKRIQKNLEDQKITLENPHYVDYFFELDDEFHSIVYEAANKPHVWRSVKNVTSHFDRVRYMDAILMSRDRSLFIEEHETIYRMLLAGVTRDDEVEAFFERHISAYKKEFNKMLSTYGEYFV